MFENEVNEYKMVAPDVDRLPMCIKKRINGLIRSSGCQWNRRC